MLKIRKFEELTEDELKQLCKRPRIEAADITQSVRSIIDDVQKRGDEAVLELTKAFDGVAPDPLLWPVRKMEDLPVEKVIKDAFIQAHDNIRRFHEAQKPKDIEVETQPGTLCRRESRPIEKVGLYIPGGSAPLPSTALMLGVPATLAGCHYKIMATPPNKKGEPPIELELAAALTGVSHIYLAGGAQAIAAMAFGTRLIEKVDKIFGPGNQFVTAAKMMLQNSDAMVGIDLPAGPSEVMVVADAGADPEFVAIDLLSQAEHGPDSQAVLVATEGFETAPVIEALESQLKTLPRAEIAKKALSHSFIVTTKNRTQALKIINLYAPEHLILQLERPKELIPHIRHAGSVFIGPWTPESVGDYASGTNHTLPTYGYARMYSGVSLDSFLKHITFQELTPAGLAALAPCVTKMAETEHLEAHRQAVILRMARLDS